MEGKLKNRYFILVFISIMSWILFYDNANAFLNKKVLIENEKNTISVFNKNMYSVVNITSIQHARLWPHFDSVEIPSGAGSGIVWDNKGHILTNFHIVQKSHNLVVTFHRDKKQYKAKVVGKEPKKDIAVLKLIEMPKKLHPITYGNSKALQVGQKAIAIGSPFGLNNTITQGIVSALNRKIDGIGGVKIHGMIQTDAAINPGNSGGPLLDSQGKLIGMNTLIFSKSGANAGLGFAVPVDTIKRIVPQLIEFGRVIRPVLGIIIFEERERSRYFEIKEGILIKSIMPNGAAKKAGLIGTRRDNRGRLHLGDLILKIDNKKVNKFDDIYHVLEKYKVGDSVEVTFRRDQKIKKAKLKLGSN